MNKQELHTISFQNTTTLQDWQKKLVHQLAKLFMFQKRVGHGEA